MNENLFLRVYFMMICVMRYPEMTKKMSTPINPPGRTLGHA